MNYIIKPKTWVVVASYPTPYFFIRPQLTKRLNIFTDKDLVFKKQVTLDLNVKASNLMSFVNSGWYGFKVRYDLLIVTPENIASLCIKIPVVEQPHFIPFSNMITPKNDKMSFEEWLKSNE